MRRLIHVFCVSPLLLAMPAQAADPAATYAQWQWLRDPATLEIAFDAGYQFLSRHGDWPEIKIIQLRTEEASLRENPPQAKSFCASMPPISGRGMFACAQAGVGSAAERAAWVKQGWLQGDFSPFEEKNILLAYSDQLTSKDHEARTDRLLYEGKTSAALRMLPLLSADWQKLAQARIALSMGAKDAVAKMNAVPEHFKHHPGLTLARLRWRNIKGLNMEMRDLFTISPDDPPYADQWWPLRAIAVREALQAAQYDDALMIIAKHGDLKPEFLAEALWLKGWITLEYAHDAGSAYQDFYKLYGSVSTPVSLARAAYWAARAAKRNGNTDIAHDWLEKAADNPTVFYGQLAHAELHPGESLDLPSQPSVSDSAKSEFARQELPRVIRMLADQGDQDMVDRFVIHMGERATTPEEFALLASLASDINAAHGGVVVSKMALRKGIILIKAGWPTMPTPTNLAIEPALAHAITRQESEFDSRAQSAANARGLMQLLPGTALLTAKKLGLPFAPPDIWDPETNVTLGSAYLGQMIDARDGSYILGIASYNAGPRNALNWASDFGPPPSDVEGAVNWIENIPFGETRNYVQRVLENLQIYRQLLKQSERVKLAEDLKR